jgi:hypothetical protein
MLTAKKFSAPSVLIGVAIALYVAWGLYTRNEILTEYKATKPGETLESVLKRFGQPSHIEPHSNFPGYDQGSRNVCGESCWIRLWYELPLDMGTSPVTVDFDSQQVVIDKYRWSSP